MSAQPAGPAGAATGPWSRPVPPPRLLTVTEYLAIGEVEPGYTELLEGQVLMSPGPAPDHNHAASEIRYQLRGRLPADLEAIQDVDVDLQLAPPDAPGTVRRPDLVVAPRTARRRVRREGGVLRASEVVVAVEILSPGSHRTDHVHKRGEYADAGIGHYWIVDLGAAAARSGATGPVSLLACHLAGDFGYADGGVVTGRFISTTPFPAELDLDALL
ncbi:Uma2 family endonuclease [Pseudonocardia nematodicida]|uniref:Uma2 family endonuclease n=1 Tax=Pseudonocardia nematodicida TaxID=1206997 RepID=A0ABV1KCG8_9PSEU